MNIVIDAGHGGSDWGATNKRTGLREKNVVLFVAFIVAERVREYSHGRITPHLTRSDDSFISLRDRREFANRLNAPLLSVHCNAGGGTGFEAFTWPGFSSSDPWATSLLTAWTKDGLNVSTLRGDFRDGDPDKEARFTVLGTKREAVLFELGFIDRAEDEAVLRREDFQILAAESLARTTVDHFLKEKEVLPTMTPQPITLNTLPAIPRSPDPEYSNSATKQDVLSRIKAIEWQLLKIKKTLS